MAFKVIILCATALLIQTTFGQCMRNAEVTIASQSCECSGSASSSTSSSKIRSGTGSGTVRGIGIGSFQGGQFISGSGSSNIESACSNSVNNVDSLESCECSSISAGSSANNVASSNASSSKTRSGSGSGSVRAVGIGNFDGNCNSGFSSNNIQSFTNVGNAGFGFINAGRSVSNAGRAVGSLACSGGPFIITCDGPVAPSGINVNAYNDLIGDLFVSGQLPFLSAVAFDGTFPTYGHAAVSYGCGDGRIAINEVIGDSCGCFKI